jgi:hypothetical protein
MQVFPTAPSPTVTHLMKREVLMALQLPSALVLLLLLLLLLRLLLLLLLLLLLHHSPIHYTHTTTTNTTSIAHTLSIYVSVPLSEKDPKKKHSRSSTREATSYRQQQGREQEVSQALSDMAGRRTDTHTHTHTGGGRGCV